jgi:uncharacterized protein involved in response to NO
MRGGLARQAVAESSPAVYRIQWDASGTTVLLLLMAIVQTARLSRWAGFRTWREPILFVLHVGYAFVPLGALILSLSILWPPMLPASGALHAWTTGAMGIMTLGVMTRATLGHTGREVVSTTATHLRRDPGSRARAHCGAIVAYNLLRSAGGRRLGGSWHSVFSF